MYNKNFCSALAITAFLFAYEHSATANCVTDAQDVTTGDIDDQVHTRFMNMSAVNRQNFVDTFCHEYLNYGCHFFKGYGWSNWEDSATLWAKWANAAWLVNFGYISDNMATSDCSPDGGFCLNYNDRPWHGRTDYRRLGKSTHTYAHDEFEVFYAWSDSSSGALGRFDKFYDVISEDEWETLYCPLFDPVREEAQPVTRAGVLVHEGQHAWQYRYHSEIWHDVTCQHKGEPRQHDCDNWNYHRRHDMADGALRTPYYCIQVGHGCQPSGPNTEHRPYQVEWEFFCDLAEHPNHPLPLDVQIKADSVARDRGAYFANNGPVPHCGSPLPNDTRPISPKAQCPWTGCDSVQDCAFYGIYREPICASGCCAEGYLPPIN